MSEPRWMPIARSYIGQAEVPGLENNSTIVRWWGTIKTSFRDDETPWCAAFVGGVLEEAGIVSSRSAAARSYLNWGVACAPMPGCVVVFSRPGSSWSGHVAFLVGKDGAGRWLCLGGNQGDRVSIAPFDAARVIGCRWPDGQEMAAAGPLPVYASAGAASSTNEA